jgi:hypothetical protein
MRAVFYVLTILFGVIALLALLRFIERLVFGDFTSQAFMQLGIGLLMGLIAVKTLSKARAS